MPNINHAYVHENQPQTLEIQDLMALRANLKAESLYYAGTSQDDAAKKCKESNSAIEEFDSNTLFTVVRLFKLGEMIEVALVTDNQKNTVNAIISQAAHENRRHIQLKSLDARVQNYNRDSIIQIDHEGSIVIDEETKNKMITATIADLLKEKSILDVELYDRLSDVVKLAEMKYEIRESVLTLIRRLNKTIDLLSKKDIHEEKTADLKAELEKLKKLLVSKDLDYDTRLLLEILHQLEDYYKSIKESRGDNDYEAERVVTSLILDVNDTFLSSSDDYRLKNIELKQHNVETDDILNAEAQVLSQKYYQIAMELIRKGADIGEVVRVFTGSKTIFEAFTAPLYTEKSPEVRKVVAREIITQVQSKLQNAEASLPDAKIKRDETQMRYDAVHSVESAIQDVILDDGDNPFIFKKSSGIGYYVQLGTVDYEKILQDEKLNSLEDLIAKRNVSLLELKNELQTKENSGVLGLRSKNTNERISNLPNLINQVETELIVLTKIQKYTKQLGLDIEPKGPYFEGLGIIFEDSSYRSLSSIARDVPQFGHSSILTVQKRYVDQLVKTIETGNLFLQKAEFEQNA